MPPKCFDGKVCEKKDDPVMVGQCSCCEKGFEHYEIKHADTESMTLDAFGEE